VASDSSMCSGVDSTSINEYQDNPGGKGGRCVRLTTYHLHVPIVKKSGSLNLLEPCGPAQACNGTALQKKHCLHYKHKAVNVCLDRIFAPKRGDALGGWRKLCS
jgi:hypothetical protein